MTTVYGFPKRLGIHARPRQSTAVASGALARPAKQVAGGGHLGDHLGHVRVDRLAPSGHGDGHAMVSVLDEVQAADAVHLDRRNRHGRRDPADAGPVEPTSRTGPGLWNQFKPWAQWANQHKVPGSRAFG